jgi:hypothetical protein
VEPAGRVWSNSVPGGDAERTGVVVQAATAIEYGLISTVISTVST